MNLCIIDSPSPGPKMAPLKVRSRARKKRRERDWGFLVVFRNFLIFNVEHTRGVREEAPSVESLRALGRTSL